MSIESVVSDSLYMYRDAHCGRHRDGIEVQLELALNA